MRSMRPEVKDGPRRAILDYVEQYPGAHLRGIERMTSLPLGQVLYHLDRLERMGILASKRDAGFRRYYPTRTVGRDAKAYLAALRQPACRRVIIALLDEGPLPHKRIQERLDVAGSTLSFHLQRLLEAGVLQREAHGSQNLYSIVDAETAREEVIYWRASFADREVDAYVRRSLATLPPFATRVPLAPQPPAPPDREAASVHS